MSVKHLATGSQEPTRVEGLLRLYSNYFCPYVHRTRLVLNAKKIPHDIVNIDITNKPEWYFKINEQGKVPSLLDAPKIVIESLDISDYLDEKYPENPLYPSDATAKKQDKELIQKIGPVTGVFAKIAYGTEEKTHEEWSQIILETLQPFENELAERGTTFFGGDKPGMVDYMLWPWEERSGGMIRYKLGKDLHIDDKIPFLRKWRDAMLKDTVVAEIYIPPEKLIKLMQRRLKGEAANYDDL